MTDTTTAENPEARDARHSVRKPCRECPFSRKCEPNALGGSGPTVFVGQAYGPFWLPCHMHTDYSDPHWKADTSKPQCAGAAMFRNIVGVDKYLPDKLGMLKLTGDRSLVFSDAAEMLAHHGRVPKSVAQLFLLQHPIQELAAIEIKRCSNVGWTKESV